MTLDRFSVIVFSDIYTDVFSDGGIIFRSGDPSGSPGAIDDQMNFKDKSKTTSGPTNQTSQTIASTSGRRNNVVIDALPCDRKDHTDKKGLVNNDHGF